MQELGKLAAAAVSMPEAVVGTQVGAVMVVHKLPAAVAGTMAGSCCYRSVPARERAPGSSAAVRAVVDTMVDSCYRKLEAAVGTPAVAQVQRTRAGLVGKTIAGMRARSCYYRPAPADTLQVADMMAGSYCYRPGPVGNPVVVQVARKQEPLAVGNLAGSYCTTVPSVAERSKVSPQAIEVIEYN